MKILRIVAVFAVVALSGAPIGLHSAAAQNAATPEALEAARDLMAVLNKDTLNQMVSRMTEQVWPTLERGLRTKQPKISDGVVAELRSEFERIQIDYLSGLPADAPVIYARHFSAAELRELLAFYRTPIGEKSLRELPQITAGAIALIVPRLQQVRTQTMDAFTKILRQRGLEI
jgi:uncharacterized protein